MHSRWYSQVVWNMPWATLRTPGPAENGKSPCQQDARVSSRCQLDITQTGDNLFRKDISSSDIMAFPKDDTEQPLEESSLPQKESFDKKNPPSPQDEKPPEPPLASLSDICSFIPNVKTKIYLGVGMFFAFLSGCFFPAMAFLFARSFEDLSGAVGTSLPCW